MAAKKKTTKKRTTLRSTAGTKLYAKRGAGGQFEDIQTYRRAHGQDVKRVSKAEAAARKKGGEVSEKGLRRESGHPSPSCNGSQVP